LTAAPFTVGLLFQVRWFPLAITARNRPFIPATTHNLEHCPHAVAPGQLSPFLCRLKHTLFMNPKLTTTSYSRLRIIVTSVHIFRFSPLFTLHHTIVPFPFVYPQYTTRWLYTAYL